MSYSTEAWKVHHHLDRRSRVSGMWIDMDIANHINERGVSGYRPETPRNTNHILIDAILEKRLELIQL